MGSIWSRQTLKLSFEVAEFWSEAERARNSVSLRKNVSKTAVKGVFHKDLLTHPL